MGNSAERHTKLNSVAQGWGCTQPTIAHYCLISARLQGHLLRRPLPLQAAFTQPSAHDDATPPKLKTLLAIRDHPARLLRIARAELAACPEKLLDWQVYPEVLPSDPPLHRDAASLCRMVKSLSPARRAVLGALLPMLARQPSALDGIAKDIVGTRTESGRTAIDTFDYKKALLRAIVEQRDALAAWSSEWSPKIHRFFPGPFRDAVHVLLHMKRLHSIPMDVFSLLVTKLWLQWPPDVEAQARYHNRVQQEARQQDADLKSALKAGGRARWTGSAGAAFT